MSLSVASSIAAPDTARGPAAACLSATGSPQPGRCGGIRKSRDRDRPAAGGRMCCAAPSHSTPASSLLCTPRCSFMDGEGFLLVVAVIHHALGDGADELLHRLWILLEEIPRWTRTSRRRAAHKPRPQQHVEAGLLGHVGARHGNQRAGDVAVGHRGDPLRLALKQEGGTRVDTAMRSAWDFPNGGQVEGLVGRSYRLDNDFRTENPYPAPGSTSGPRPMSRGCGWRRCPGSRPSAACAPMATSRSTASWSTPWPT